MRLTRRDQATIAAWRWGHITDDQLRERIGRAHAEDLLRIRDRIARNAARLTEEHTDAEDTPR